MKCSKYQHMIDLAIGGDLSPSEQTKLERHLCKCAACSQEMQVARSAYKRVAALGFVVPKQLKPKKTVDAVLGRITADH